MSKISRIALRILLVAILLVLIAGLYLRYGVTAFHHERIEQTLSDATGLVVEADSPLQLELGRKISVRATNVSLRDPQDSESKLQLELGKVHVVLDARTLLSGVVDLEHFRIDNVNAVTESSDGSQFSVSAPLSAAGSVDLSGERPRVDVDIETTRLDIVMPATPETEDAAPEDPAVLFSNEALDLSFLSTIDAGLRLDAETITVNQEELGGLSLEISVHDGALNLPTFSYDQADASVSGSLSIEPDADTYQLVTSAELVNWRSALFAIDGLPPSSIPPFNGSISLSGSGSSVHDIMGSANGQIQGRHDAGEVDLKAAGALFADVAASLVQSLNPLAETNTNGILECGIYDIAIVDGIANVEQLSVQTDRLTVISSGEIDLGTEIIDMAIRTKSREGLGLSIGSVATSFVKLGGTLSEPSVNVDAGGTVATTGAAVATGGLSVLAKGLWDRVSSEADLCKAPESDEPLPQP